MYLDIRMSRSKLKITADGPILSGSISTAMSQCGKPNCACKAKRPRLHGPFYRWTGVIDGKRTTKTISKDLAKECERRIARYRTLQKKLDQILKEAILDGPWK